MLSPDPDITRLLDRMETQGLVRRDRAKEDRRVVITRITDRGLDLVNRLDEPLQQLLQKHLGRVGRQRLRDLVETLEILREPA
jgi:DNA-binding MarR family transcriptional regulator